MRVTYIETNQIRSNSFLSTWMRTSLSKSINVCSVDACRPQNQLFWTMYGLNTLVCSCPKVVNGARLYKEILLRTLRFLGPSKVLALPSSLGSLATQLVHLPSLWDKGIQFLQLILIALGVFLPLLGSGHILSLAHHIHPFPAALPWYFLDMIRLVNRRLNWPLLCLLLRQVFHHFKLWPTSSDVLTGGQWSEFCS